jgi:hypothetical protein
LGRFAGWSVCLSGGLSIISGAFLLLFYALEVPRMSTPDGMGSQTFGTLNDIATLFQFLCLLPLTLVLHRLAPLDRRGLSMLGMVVGVVGLLGVVMSFAVNLPLVMIAFGLFGVWMLLANHLVRASGALSPRLAWLGQVTGIAFILMSALTLLTVFISWRDPSAVARLGDAALQSPVLVGSALIVGIPLLLAFFIAVPRWDIWLGRRLHAMAAGTAELQSGGRRQVHAGASI